MQVAAQPPVRPPAEVHKLIPQHHRIPVRGGTPASVPITLEPFVAPLTAGVLNLDGKMRANAFPWRGQFSPELVEALLGAYASDVCSVLDPFMGSGTVLVESARRGYAAYGVEVNPAAYLLGRVYRLCNVPETERRDLLDRTTRILSGLLLSDLPLLQTYSPDHREAFEPRLLLASTDDALVQTLLQATVILHHAHAGHKGAWDRAWAALRQTVLGLPYSTAPIYAMIGDARRLPFADHSIDFVLSSPPYINVFNYHHNARSAVEMLGWQPLVVATSEIGANRKFRQNRFLTVVQYCMDMAMALAEIRRVCTDRGRVLLVLGRESNVHMTPLYNGEIVEQLATRALGFRVDLKQRRVFTNRFGQKIYEDLLHFSVSNGAIRACPLLLEDARLVALEILRDARQRVPADRSPFLESAISKATMVAASPLLDLRRAKGDI